MGSGISGNYKGTYGARQSQPYASRYSVLTRLKQFDIQSGVYKKNVGYIPNPTATKISEAMQKNHTFHINGHRIEGKLTYVINVKGEIIIGTRDRSSPLRSPHPRLIGGLNPKVKCAGMIEFRKGRIYAIDNHSGHYKPNIKSMKWVYKALSQLPKDAFHKHFKSIIKS